MPILVLVQRMPNQRVHIVDAMDGDVPAVANITAQGQHPMPISMHLLLFMVAIAITINLQ